MEESLTISELAAAAGLDRATTTRYCARFADHLIPAEPPRPEHWAPISVALLQIIHELELTGLSDADIDAKLREDSADATPSDGPAPPAPSPAPTAPTTQDRVETLRGEIKARPFPPDEPRAPAPWWQRFGRRN